MPPFFQNDAESQSLFGLVTLRYPQNDEDLNLDQLDYALNDDINNLLKLNKMFIDVSTILLSIT